MFVTPRGDFSPRLEIAELHSWLRNAPRRLGVFVKFSEGVLDVPLVDGLVSALRDCWTHIGVEVLDLGLMRASGEQAKAIIRDGDCVAKLPNVGKVATHRRIATLESVATLDDIAYADVREQSDASYIRRLRSDSRWITLRSAG